MPKAARNGLAIVLVIAAFVGWKMYNKSKDSAAVREQAVQLVQAFPRYDENKDYYDASFDELHEEAFDQAYKVGGRRSSAKFDDTTYLAVLVALYQRKARVDGKTELAEAFELHRKALQLPPVQFPE